MTSSKSVLHSKEVPTIAFRTFSSPTWHTGFHFCGKLTQKYKERIEANEDAAPPGILVNVDALAKESTIKRGHPGLKYEIAKNHLDVKTSGVGSR